MCTHLWILRLLYFSHYIFSCLPFSTVSQINVTLEVLSTFVIHKMASSKGLVIKKLEYEWDQESNLKFPYRFSMWILTNHLICLSFLTCEVKTDALQLYTSGMRLLVSVLWWWSPITCKDINVICEWLMYKCIHILTYDMYIWKYHFKTLQLPFLNVTSTHLLKIMIHIENHYKHTMHCVSTPPLSWSKPQ